MVSKRNGQRADAAPAGLVSEQAVQAAVEARRSSILQQSGTVSPRMLLGWLRDDLGLPDEAPLRPHRRLVKAAALRLLEQQVGWTSHCAVLCPCHCIAGAASVGPPYACRASCPPAALLSLRRATCRPTPCQPSFAGWITTACSARCRSAGPGMLPARPQKRLVGCGSSSVLPGAGARRQRASSSSSSISSRL